MTAEVVPLYPTRRAAQPVQGLYLAHRLHELGSTATPFVYGNFVSSLDGRIAIMESTGANSDALSGAKPWDSVRWRHV